MRLISCGGLTVFHIDGDDVQIGQRTEQIDAFAREEPTPGGEQTPGAQDGSNTSMSKQI